MSVQFLVVAHDGRDEEARERRLRARPAHMAGLEKMKRAGEALYGAAILDEQERMIGSAMVVDFAARSELDAWLAAEPYVVGRVWERIDVHPCRVAPLFLPEDLCD
jgi:uncharacterized protein